MEEDIKIYGHMPNLFEISADVLLYWTLRAVNFKRDISEQDLHRYHDAICKSYDKYRLNIKEQLAFHFPYIDNYQQEVFEKIVLPNGKTGFRIVTAKGTKAKELLQYRLVKLDAFVRKQKPEIKAMLVFADYSYRMEISTLTFPTEKSSKGKVFKMFHNFKKKVK